MNPTRGPRPRLRSFRPGVESLERIKLLSTLIEHQGDPSDVWTTDPRTGNPPVDLGRIDTPRHVADRIGNVDDIDFYKFQARAGQYLTFDIDGDGTLRSLIAFYREGDRRKLFSNVGTSNRGSHEPSERGRLSVDPFSTIIIPQDGTYFVPISSYVYDTYRPDTTSDRTLTQSPKPDTRGSYTLFARVPNFKVIRASLRDAADPRQSIVTVTYEVEEVALRERPAFAVDGPSGPYNAVVPTVDLAGQNVALVGTHVIELIVPKNGYNAVRIDPVGTRGLTANQDQRFGRYIESNESDNSAAIVSDPIRGGFTAYRETPGGTVPVQRALADRLVPESEEDTVGVGIRINGDDDNRNGKPDATESNASVRGEDDLIQLNLDLKNVPLSGTEYRLVVDNPGLRGWDSESKNRPVRAINSWQSLTIDGSFGRTIWLEWAGTSQGSATVALEVRNASTGAIQRLDTLRVSTFRSRVLLFSGETTIFGRGSGNPLDSGMLTVANALARSGYDVSYYAPRDVRASTLPVDELRRAIEGHKQYSIAMLGHSHGAGSVYSLGTLLGSSPWGRNALLSLTGYVDAIQHGLTNISELSRGEESRRPPSAYHVNVYQRNFYSGAFLRGNQTFDPGRDPLLSPRTENYDLTGPGVDHSNISKLPFVTDLFIQRTRQMVSR